MRVGGGEEEHGRPLDERAIVVRELGAHHALDDPIRELARLETVLQPSRAVVEESVLHRVYLAC
jgi:hypothetical protein